MHEHKIEWSRPCGNDGVHGIRPEIAGSEVRDPIAEGTQKFVAVLLAVCSNHKTPNPRNPWVPVVIIVDVVKALGNFNRGLRKV